MTAALEYRGDQARSFAEEVARRSGQNLYACYQCRRCAAGCPVSEETDYLTPDRLIRSVVLGDRQTALGNELVWRCVSCYTCGTRCPNDIQTGRITETLKKMAKEEHVVPLRPKVKYFHDAFMGSAQRWGRVNEMEMMGFYEMHVALDSVKKGEFKSIIDEMIAQVKNFALPMLKTGRLMPEIPSFHGKAEIKKLLAIAKNKK